MKKLHKVLEESIAQEQVLRSARAWAALRLWPEVVGSMLAEKSSPDRYENGTVWVAVLGSAWSSELRMQKDKILGRLRQISGEPDLFFALRFGVRKFEKAVIVVEVEPVPPTERPSGSIREIGDRLIKKLQDEGRT